MDPRPTDKEAIDRLLEKGSETVRACRLSRRWIMLSVARSQSLVASSRLVTYEARALQLGSDDRQG